ncbi:uncharacterized protein LOC124273693 isoform X1 [Haliotis rubra]|uniref:uncharacterized protein LOC124273693 isoform X1 n=1 Tax=Haliotis rubra TaxID=36100 RepID=UPI001EE55745|nr:uncharacterized protein LOC124273693 isoform X1 [Haliotis rubra]
MHIKKVIRFLEKESKVTRRKTSNLRRRTIQNMFVLGTDLIPSTQAWEHMFKRMVMMMGAAEGVLDPLELPGAQTLADVNNGIQLRDDKCLLYDKLFGLDLKDSKGDLATIRSETG